MGKEMDQQFALIASGKSHEICIARAKKSADKLRAEDSDISFAGSLIVIFHDDTDKGGLGKKIIEGGLDPVAIIQSTCRKLYEDVKDVKNLEDALEDKYESTTDSISLGKFFWLSFEMRRAFQSKDKNSFEKARGDRKQWIDKLQAVKRIAFRRHRK